MDKTYCPLIKGTCREDCVLRYHPTATSEGISTCLLAVKLGNINEYQHDDLTEILHAVGK